MTGAECALAGERLALAHTAIHPVVAVWLADNSAAADKLAEWELEGHPRIYWPPCIALRALLE